MASHRGHPIVIDFQKLGLRMKGSIGEKASDFSANMDHTASLCFAN
jgi:hypothetical protein